MVSAFKLEKPFESVVDLVIIEYLSRFVMCSAFPTRSCKEPELLEVSGVK